MELWLSPPLMHVRARRASARSAPHFGCSLIAPALGQVPHLLQCASYPVLVVRGYIPAPPFPLANVKGSPRAVASTLFSLRSPWNSTRICRFVSETGMGEVGALDFETRVRRTRPLYRGCSQVAGNQSDRGIDRRNIVTISVARRWQALVQ